MLHRVGAGADGIARSGRAVRVNGDPLAECVGGLDGGLHFLEREDLEAGDVPAGAGRAVHLDAIGSRGHMLANHAHYLGGAIDKEEIQGWHANAKANHAHYLGGAIDA